MNEQNQYSLKEALREMVERYRLKSGLSQTRVEQLWGELMGETVRRHTIDVLVRHKKLFIRLDSAPLREELAIGREKIRKLINEELGEDYLREVILR